MKKKVLFVLPSLRGGGAERVIVTLLNHFDRRKFELHLALVEKEGAYLKNVPFDVPVYDLAAGRVRNAFKPLLKLIKQLKPDTIFSTQGHMNLALIFLKPFLPKEIKLIVREASIVSECLKQSKFPKLWKICYKFFYKKADLIVCQSKHMKSDLKKNFNVPELKMVHIYNPVDIKAIKERASIGSNPFSNTHSSPNIVAIGRLAYEKGFDRLIDSVPKLLKMKPNAKIWILGEGQLEAQLRQQRDRLGLHKYIEFVGFQENPYTWLKYSDLFVLSSYYEGLSNVLLEAIACDCPVIALDHLGGTGEILEILGQKKRLLMELNYEEKFFEGMVVEDRLISNFGLDVVVSKYEKVLNI